MRHLRRGRRLDETAVRVTQPYPVLLCLCVRPIPWCLKAAAQVQSKQPPPDTASSEGVKRWPLRLEAAAEIRVGVRQEEENWPRPPPAPAQPACSQARSESRAGVGHPL